MAAEQDNRTEDELQALSVITYLPTLMANYEGSLLSVFYGAFGDNIWLVHNIRLALTNRFRRPKVIAKPFKKKA